LALTQDQTFVASGHASGHIFLYNLSKPLVPVRSVPTTTLAAVASGRKEGHLANVRISSVGFVGARHTAIVSADENGLAFYHSLGKVLFVEAPDVLRVLGKYPERELGKPPVLNVKGPLKPRKSNTILSMAPLPLGHVPDDVDSYHLTALLTPLKLVIVGLKPSPRTWFRQHRPEANPSGSSKWRGCLSWFPRVKAEDGLSTTAAQTNGASRASPTPSEDRRPRLVYSWGREIYIIRLREEKTTSMVKDQRTGKDVPVVTGRVIFESQIHWTASSDVLTLQWLNNSVSSFSTPRVFSNRIPSCLLG
jgi:hypothetical protein